MSKIYARTFQFIMKIGNYLLPWRMPEVIKGENAVLKLPSLIKDKGFKNVLIVTDKGLMNLHLLDGMINKLKEENINYIIYDNVSPNPTDENVYEGTKLYLDNNCDAMIAFGGGSPMDCAKGIGAKIAHPKRKIEQMQGLLKVLKRIPTIFTVPTTAGTGSETTIASVITISKTHHKASINDLCLMPKYAVLDPMLTVGLPPHVTSTTGLDALCHAVEAYTNNTYNSKLEKKLAKDAVKLIYDNLYDAYLDGNNITARQNMQIAAFYAGRAFTRGSVGYVHAIGHTLGGLYGVPHGLAMSILLPHVLIEYGESVYDKLADLADVCGIKGNSNKEKAQKFINWIIEMKIKMNIPTYPDMIKKEDIPQIVSWATKEANPLYPTPVFWDKKHFESFINDVLINHN